MGNSAGKQAEREARRVRDDEIFRQARVSEGTANINRIFDHGGRGERLGAGATFDPNGVYYNADGTVWQPQTSTQSTGSGGRIGSAWSAINAGAGNGTPARTPQEQFAEALAGGQLHGAAGGFDDDFFSGIANSYMDFASPQLQTQHQGANKQLMFDLARGGKLDSSTRATKGGELQEIYSLGQQQIADQALAQQNAARNSVEDARSGLISQVNATGDATGATNAARARAEALSRPAGDFSPIGDMFQGFTGQLGQRYAAERAYAASGGASRGYTPVSYGAPSGAVRVTR